MHRPVAFISKTDIDLTLNLTFNTYWVSPTDTVTVKMKSNKQIKKKEASIKWKKTEKQSGKKKVAKYLTKFGEINLFANPK